MDIDITKVSTVIGIATAIVTGAFTGGNWVDHRYQHADQALQQQQYSEQKALELDLEMKQLKLANLRAKTAPTQDDEDEIKYLVDAIAQIRKRLEGLAK